MLSQILRIWMLTGLFLSFFVNTVSAFNATTKPIATDQREQFKQYYESGSYFKEIERQLVDAKDYLERQLRQGRSNRLAIVLDIDETALTNYRGLERLAFTNNSAAVTALMMQANAEPILPVLQFYQHAIKHKVAVFFLSERPNSPEFLATTTKNLINAGYTTWEELTLKPLEKDQMSTQEFKTHARKHITELGFDIILNIGDQYADVEGGYAEARLRLPNPFYELT